MLMDASFYNFTRYNIIEQAANEHFIEHRNPEGRLLVLVTNEYQNPELKTLLDKILSAIKSNNENTCILEIPKGKRLKLIDSRNYKFCESIIILGFSPNELGLNIDAKAFIKISMGKHQFLFGPSLTELNTKVEYKKHLWESLKDDFIMK